MAWSEEQKAAGRLELQRLRQETSATCRAALMKAAAFSAVGLLTTVALLLGVIFDPSAWWRAAGLSLTVFPLAAFFFFGLLAYLRFRNWRTSVCTESLDA